MSLLDEEKEKIIQQGIILIQSGKPDEAIRLLTSAFNESPHDVRLRFALGNCLINQAAHLQEGLSILLPLLEMEPPSYIALSNVGIAYLQLGFPEKAEQPLRKALSIQPDDALAHQRLAYTLFTQRRYPESVFHFQEALNRNPTFFNDYLLLVIALRTGRRPFESYAWATQWKISAPNALEPNLCQALALAQTKNFKACNKIFLQCNSENRNELHYYRGHILQNQSRFTEALEAYKLALAHNPEDSSSHMNRSLILLAQGKFIEGWREFDYRFGAYGALAPHGHNEPEWDGRELNGEGILVHSEQGIGDVIQFIRFFPQIQQRGGRVIFSSYPDVLTLLQSSPDAKPVDDLSQIDLNYTWQIPILSLGKIFLPDIASIPAEVPYLYAPPQKLTAWKSKLSSLGGINIGLAWSGNPDHINDHTRSTALADMEPLARIPGINFFALQKGPTAKQAHCPPSGMFLTSLDNEINDFTDTAAIVSALDLVICVDTSIGHLAGALGKPVWMAVSEPADWRWLIDREDSPWYPTLRLFRRGIDETWGEFFIRMSTALAAWVEQQNVTATSWLAEQQMGMFAEKFAWSDVNSVGQDALEKGGNKSRIAHYLGGMLTQNKGHYTKSDLIQIENLLDGYQLVLDPDADSGTDSEKIKYREKIYQQHTDANTGLALLNTLKETGNYLYGIKLGTELINNHPERWDIQYELAQCYRLSGDDISAEHHYSSTLKISPRHPEAGINRALALQRLGKSNDALRQIQYSFVCNPFHFQMGLHVTILLLKEKIYDIAIIVAEAHLERYPEDHLTKCWYGMLLRLTFRADEAITTFRSVPDTLRCQPEWLQEQAYARAILNIQDGETALRELIEAVPEDRKPLARFSLGLLLIKQGKYAEGWLTCEARRQCQDADVFENFSPPIAPHWTGDELGSRQLLVYCEQGFGDSINFLRYLHDFKGNCIVVYQDGLGELLKNWFHRASTVFISRTEYKENPIPYDAFVNLLSLPLLTRSINTDTQWKGAYLQSVNSDNPFLSIFADESRAKIGLSWAGNPNHLNDQWRSIHILVLLPLLSVTGVCWYSLQKGVASNDALLLPPTVPILNAASLSNTFLESAHLIENLDLLITVDTALAHLAGAMGKPVWLLIPQHCDWRWGISGEQTAWYSSMRIFRQSEQGNWEDVINTVTTCLKNELLQNNTL